MSSVMPTDPSLQIQCIQVLIDFWRNFLKLTGCVSERRIVSSKTILIQRARDLASMARHHINTSYPAECHNASENKWTCVSRTRARTYMAWMADMWYEEHALDGVKMSEIKMKEHYRMLRVIRNALNERMKWHDDKERMARVIRNALSERMKWHDVMKRHEMWWMKSMNKQNMIMSDGVEEVHSNEWKAWKEWGNGDSWTNT